MLALPNVTVYGPRTLEGRVGTVAFRVNGETPVQTARRLTARGIDVAPGTSTPCSPRSLRGCTATWGCTRRGVVQASIAHYTSEEDIGRLLDALA